MANLGCPQYPQKKVPAFPIITQKETFDPESQINPD